MPEASVVGLGVASGFGYGKETLLMGLLSGRDQFAPLARRGRENRPGRAPFIGVELPEPPPVLPEPFARNADIGAYAAIAALAEAWAEAKLDAVDPERIGLIVGGGNLGARAAFAAHGAFAQGRPPLSAHYAYRLFDNDLCGLCASLFPIRGFGYCVSAASASGAVAALEAVAAVAGGRVDVCIALGALQDVSAVELRAFESLGVLAEAENFPGDACRPFDRGRRGFVYGESCAALVFSREGGGYGRVAGAQLASGRRGPQPSLEGEMRVIAKALEASGLRARDIDYVNAHGTGTPAGDDAEAEALLACGLDGAFVNSSKASIGHGLAAAGAVELVATLLQMRAKRLHPTRNLREPIRPLRLVRDAPVDCAARVALSLSFGFGGVETALVVSAP
jgi:malonyl-ACP decarboxylase